MRYSVVIIGFSVLLHLFDSLSLSLIFPFLGVVLKRIIPRVLSETRLSSVQRPNGIAVCCFFNCLIHLYLECNLISYARVDFFIFFFVFMLQTFGHMC